VEFEPLYTAEEMKAAEAGHNVDQLMERAGRAVAEATMERYPDARTITGVCGNGANGGDGRIAIEILRSRGRLAKVGEDGEPVGDSDVVIDALFGTGFHGEPRAAAAAAIENINASSARVVSVDVPSGVNASSGEVATVAVEADLSVTFHGPKVGLVVGPGRFHCGLVAIAQIGLEHRETRIQRVTSEILERVPRRREHDNKYTAGSVLVVGGAPGTTGALRLAAVAAFRADAGYVTVAVPEESLPVVEQQLLEAVKRPLSELEQAVDRAGAVAVGPGLGRGEAQKAVVRQVLSTDLPVVVDADALFELEPFERSVATVLTPHSGELGRLLGEESRWVDAHRLEAAQRAADRFHAVCLLKGADTIVAAPGEGPLVCDLGPPTLATAGTGDVLTGVIGAFLAKGMDARLAAAAGAAAQQVAAELADYEAGLMASDVVNNLGHALASARDE
jgi:ADP-dependent NAD(P)H-hydrate dehydratase / NAD(P)H-hydrate epimerase